MSKIDPEVEKILKEYLTPEELKDSVWPLKKGGSVVAWIAKHRYLEKVAAGAQISFDSPQIIEADGRNLCVAIAVTGHMDTKSEWSIGEASERNYKVSGKQDAYPYAMAEKRAKDRVILKLIGLHGLVYSDQEADNFKEGTNIDPLTGEIRWLVKVPEADDDEGWSEYTARLESIFNNATEKDELTQMFETNKPGIEKMGRAQDRKFDYLKQALRQEWAKVNQQLTGGVTQ